MINKDSIVTAYDEHLTLVEWLQKVETALDNAVLTNLGIAKLSDQGNIATYRVTATFADNTTIVSDTFTLPSTNIVTAFNNLTTLVNGFDTRITDNTNNIARALFTPSSAPSTRKVVTIDTNGAQDNVDGTELTTLMNNIVDSHGNKRFVEGDISLNTIEGVTQKYGKWSLSGSHLMIVVVGELSAGYTLPRIIASNIVLPSWIRYKIVNISGDAVSYSQMLIARKSTSGGNPPITNVDASLLKWGNLYGLTVANQPSQDYDQVFRIQFDLLIDSE